MVKQKSIVVSVLIVALTLSSLMTLANASVSYGLTCNPSTNIPCGTQTCATATTSNTLVTTVRFEWENTITHQRTICPPVTKTDGCFKNTFCPDAAVSWKVHAYYLKQDGSSCHEEYMTFTACHNYVLTMDCPGGIDVPLGDKVCVTAITTNTAVTQVEFIWTRGTTTKRDVTLGKDSNGQFKDCYTPDKTDTTWKVTAKFKTSGTNPSKDISFKVTTNKYELKSQPPCGSDVPLGTIVTVTANTTNADVDYVNFTWTNPAGNTVETQVKVTKVYQGTTYKYSYAISTKTLDIVGDWCVCAKFIDKTSCGCYTTQTVVACRRVCFNVVPEVPLLGTVGAFGAMLSGFAFKLKKKQKS